MSHLQLKTHGAEAKPMTPVEFFTSVCPKVLTVHEAICKRIGGNYAFRLFGDGGGQWTLDYAASQVHDGVRDGADLYVEMTASDFAEMLKGTLDVERAAL